jgi:chemotaxis protein MotA
MNKRKRSLDPTFLAGLVIATACILGGLVLEKGQIHDVAQVTAALIVVGGTLGAVVVSTPKDALIKAIKRAPSVLWTEAGDPVGLAEDVVRFANLVRRDGAASIEKQAEESANPLLKKGLALVADGYNAQEIRTLLEIELLVAEQRAEEDAKVFEAAGGYAPTIGIIGAVLGLMQVMKHLDSIQDVGRGIAIAFVATVYGVGIANLILLPLGSKIRAQARAASKLGEMAIEGVIAVQQGKNPRLIRQLLQPFVKGERNENALSHSEASNLNSLSMKKAS